MGEMPRILVADDDPDVLETLALAFEDAGYAVTAVSSLVDAIAQVEMSTFAFVLTDLMDHPSAQGFPALSALREAAYPTPVGITSAWPVTAEEVICAGFACFVAKPVDVNDLLSTVAAIIQQPLTDEQKRQATVVRRFLARLSKGAWDAAVALCGEEVVYLPPSTVPDVSPVEGKAAYRRHIEETARRYPHFRVEQVRVVALPRGVAARYTARWGPRGRRATLSAGLVCVFAPDGRIRQLGIRLNADRLRTLHTTS